MFINVVHLLDSFDGALYGLNELLSGILTYFTKVRCVGVTQHLKGL